MSEECNCDCHKEKESGIMKMVHCMPCCNTCPICKKHIKSIFYNEHKTKCEESYNKIGNVFDMIDMDKVIKEIKDNG